MDDDSDTLEIWYAHTCGSMIYRVYDLRESDRTFLVRIYQDVRIGHCEAIIEGGHAHVRTDVRAARIRTIAKRAHRSPGRTATMESRSGEAEPTE